MWAREVCSQWMMMLQISHTPNRFCSNGVEIGGEVETSFLQYIGSVHNSEKDWVTDWLAFDAWWDSFGTTLGGTGYNFLVNQRVWWILEPNLIWNKRYEHDSSLEEQMWNLIVVTATLDEHLQVCHLDVLCGNYCSLIDIFLSLCCFLSSPELWLCNESVPLANPHHYKYLSAEPP